MTDYTMMWLAIMIVLIGIEIVTVGLTTIWFAIGALVAILVAVLGGGFILQVAVFRSFAGNADIYETFCNEVHKYNAFQNKL